MSSAKNRDHELLASIKASVAFIRSYTIGMSIEQFALDTKTQDAVAMRLQDISEQMTRLSEKTKSRHPAIPWDEIKGLRNRISHGYSKIDHEIIWAIVSSSDLSEIETLAVTELSRHKSS
jgi:uncharacterized protein with HEPN domain